MRDILLSAITGIDPTAQLYLNNLAVGSPITMVEVAATGEYVCDMPSAAAGEYLIVFIDAGEKIGSGWIVWDGEKETDYLSFMAKVVKNKREIKKVGSTWMIVVYDNDGVTPILSKPLKDVVGGEIADLATGILAQEGASSV